jgi:hypothetical protein
MYFIVDSLKKFDYTVVGRNRIFLDSLIPGKTFHFLAGLEIMQTKQRNSRRRGEKNINPFDRRINKPFR